MKQLGMFGDTYEPREETIYTKKIKAPVYEPKNKKPYIQELYDPTTTLKMINEINGKEGISEEEKKFLVEAARRHTVFNYSKIADYYAHASKEMQELMEASALVIIDFKKAIEYGYVKLAEEIKQEYL